MKEAAAEECASQCRDLASPGKAAEAASADSYDACYAKCVAQETKEIAAERVEVCLALLPGAAECVDSWL